MITYKRASSENIRNVREFLQMDQPRFKAYYKSSIKHEVKIEAFRRITTIGVGSFGRVYLIEETHTRKLYALKQFHKKKVVESGLVDYTWQEKRLLQSTNFPFLVYMKYYFSDNSNLYFVLPFLIGGELFNFLKNKKKFDEPLSQFYAAQLVLALEYLHYMKIVYRDLKPENVLIDEIGYIKIADFGFCKMIADRTYTFCGTPEYLAPEILLNKGYGLAVDWWALGVIVYEMNNGTPPFHHWDQVVLFEKIATGNYSSPSEFSDSLKDIINKLITVDLTKRLGNLRNGVDDIKKHRWFNRIVWLTILNREVQPPYKPEFSNPMDTSNFQQYTEETDQIAAVEEYPDIFSNF